MKKKVSERAASIFFFLLVQFRQVVVEFDYVELWRVFFDGPTRKLLPRLWPCKQRKQSTPKSLSHSIHNSTVLFAFPNVVGEFLVLREKICHAQRHSGRRVNPRIGQMSSRTSTPYMWDILICNGSTSGFVTSPKVLRNTHVKDEQFSFPEIIYVRRQSLMFI